MQNILIACPSPVQVKIADFGISKSEKGTTLKTELGTEMYMAPERKNLLPVHLRSSGGYTMAVDLWALGIIVHEMLTAYHPFHPASSGSAYRNTDMTGVAKGPVSLALDLLLMANFCSGAIELPTHFLQDSRAPETAVQFVKALLVANPSGRMSAADSLRHQWLRSDEMEME